MNDDFFGIFGCITRKVAFISVRGVLAYVRDEMKVPDDVRRQIAQKKC